MLTRNDTNIQSLLDENTHVIVQFGASWCRPCMQLKPKVEKISLESPDIVFAYVDIEATQDFSKQNQVLSVPTTIGFHNGIEVERVVGDNFVKVKGLVEMLRSRVNEP